MKNVNLMAKLKVLKGIHSAMDQKDSERLKPKAVTMDSVSEPKTAMEPEHRPGMHSLNPPGADSAMPGLADDDKARLMDLYSKLK